MPDDDWALGNLTVEFRDEERRWANEAGMSRADYEWVETELAFCTQTDDCQADAAEHLDDCPVEQRLREELGF